MKLSLAALGLAGISGCAQVAGLGDHDLGSGASSSSGSSSSSGAGGAKAFPSTPILDDFNRADGDVGSSWTQAVPGAWQVSLQHLATTVKTPDAMTWKAPFGSAEEVYVKLGAGFVSGSGDGEVELLFKATAVGECPAVYMTTANPGFLTVGYCLAGGAFTNVQMVGTTPLVGDTIGGRSRADGFFEVYRNGNLLATVDVTAAQNKTGHIGVYASALGAPLVLDDFGGGDVQ